MIHGCANEGQQRSNWYVLTIVGSRTRTVPRWWLPTAAALSATILAAGLIVLREASGPRPPTGSEAARVSLGQRDGAVHIAGSGSCLPLIRALADSMEVRGETLEVVIHGSIGSSGGVRAVEQGVVDVGLVARREGGPPRLRASRVIPLARAAVVVAVHPSVPGNEITNRELVEIFAGRQTRWSDGSMIVPMLREQGDSATGVAALAIEGLEDTIAAARRGDRWPTLLTDPQMGDALEATAGSIGLYDLGAIILERRDIHVLALDGVEPTQESIETGRYPLTRVLSLIIGPDPSPSTERVIELLESEASRRIIEEAGYAPVGEGPSPESTIPEDRP